MKQYIVHLTALNTIFFLLGCGAGSGTSNDKTQAVVSNSLSSSSVAPIGSCSFNGQTLPNDSITTAFQNSSVSIGSTCVSESRHCVDGHLSGSYSYATCSIAQPASCLFNGTTVADGTSITAYTSSNVAYGISCTTVAETRTCNNGVLTGSAQYSSCATNSPRSCLFNGSTILNGISINAYQNSTTQYGGTCTSESRICSDGTLSGSFQFGSCTVDQPASCLFDGKTIANGQTIAAFSTSTAPYGQTCGQEIRICNNGVLSGSFNFSSCTVGSPASCSLNGKTLLSGESITVFSSASVPYGSQCKNEVRSCLNGVLSGSYTSPTCSVDAAANCSVNGVSVANNSSITMFTTSSVPYGQICKSEVRNCSNGVLSGSVTNANCTIDKAPIAKDCSFNGNTIVSGQSVITYQSNNVSYGSLCVSESRLCTDGVLSGTYLNSTCTVQAPAICTLNGKTIQSGNSVTVFLKSSVPYGQTCQSEVRSCNNGVLSGTSSIESCLIDPAPPTPTPTPTPQSCDIKKIIWEFPDSCKGNCGSGNGYFKSRVSRDGGATWLNITKENLPQDLLEIWNHLIKKTGTNQCGRPNLNYVTSVHKGYIVIKSDSLPGCDICKFVDADDRDDKDRDNDDDRDHHRDRDKCEHKKHKKEVKFICESPKHDERDHDDDEHKHEHDDDHILNRRD